MQIAFLIISILALFILVGIGGSLANIQKVLTSYSNLKLSEMKKKYGLN